MLVYWPSQGNRRAYMHTSHYDPEFGWHLEGSEHDNPTHWCELPDPPNAVETETP